MAQTYIYAARDQNGQAVNGTILAENEAAVATFIRNKGHYVTKIQQQKDRITLLAIYDKFSSVTTKELSIFCRQFATMFNAGLPLISCLTILIEQTYNRKFKKVLQEIVMKVQEGEALSKAMEGHSRVFPAIMVSMIEAGEVGGVMDTVLERLSLQFEKEHKLNEKVKSALTYPLVVISMMSISLVFMLTFVLPTFLKLYDGMKVQLPLPTRILLGISNFITNHFVVLLGIFLAVGYSTFMVLRDPVGKRYLEGIIMKLPVFGILWRKTAIARFSRTLSTLVKGGVPIISALEVVKKTTGSLTMIEALTTAQESVSAGLGLAVPLGAAKVFTPMVVQMVAVGEETGELDKMLAKVADFYESDVEDMVARLSSMLEPILITFLGVVIGSIIIAVVLPLFDVVTNMQQTL